MKSFCDSLKIYLKKASKITVISHKRPDGDAIGSTLAMGIFLENEDKNVNFINYDPIPENLKFLPKSEKIKSNFNQIKNTDLIIFLDVSNKERINNDFWKTYYEITPKIPTVNIDHHISNTYFSDLNYVDSKSSSCAEIIYKISKIMNWKLTKSISINLYSAISTDTGNFKFSSTSSKTMKIASKLIKMGASVDQINQSLYENNSINNIEIMKHLLQEVMFCNEEKCAFIKVSLKFKKKLSVSTIDYGYILNLLRSIGSIKIVIIFEELDDNTIKISSRSKDRNIDVEKICKAFGGGGHNLAAGATVKGNLDDVSFNFIKVASKEIE